MEIDAAESVHDADSKPVLPPRAASAARRRAALERLTKDNKAPCAWNVGDRVQVRDKHDSEKSEDATPAPRMASLGWKSGKVVSLNPVKVQLDGGSKGYVWHEIQAAPRKKPVADAHAGSQEFSKEAGKDDCHDAKRRPSSARGRSLSAENARRAARSISIRRRKKEWEVRSKEREQEEHLSRVLNSESSKGLPLPQVAEQKQAEKLSKLRRCIEDLQSPNEDAEVGKELTIQPLTVLRLHRCLTKKDLKLQDLAVLPVKERKRLLSELGHPFPNAVVTQTDFVEWLQQKLWLRKAKADSRLAMENEGTLQKLASNEQADLIDSLNRRVQEAKQAVEERGETFNLAQLFKTLAVGDRKFKIDDLKCLPLKEFKKLMESLGVTVAGRTKDDIINQLHRRDWFRRAHKKPSKEQTQAFEKLSMGSRQEVIATLKRHLNSQNEDMPEDVVALDRLLEKLQLPIEALTFLQVGDLKPIMDRLGLVFPGSKAECIALLNQQLWSARAQRQPSARQVEILERLGEPAKHTVVSCSPDASCGYRKKGCDMDDELPSTDLEEYDDDLPLPMQYDMFVPQAC